MSGENLPTAFREDAGPSNRVLQYCSILFATACSAGTILLIAPMPHRILWLFAVLVNEYSVWLLIASTAGVGICVAASLRLKSKKYFVCTALCLVSSTVTAWITAQTFVTANDLKVRLSLLKYFADDQNDSLHTRKTRDVSFDQTIGSNLRLDVYDAAQTSLTQPLQSLKPAVVILHGGSWSHGHKSEYPKFDEWLSQNGYVVFDLSYRAANPSCIFPAQLNDVDSGVSWVKHHATQYGADGSRIAILGRSAGAQLALIEGLKNAKDIKCIVSFYAPTDLEWDFDHPCFPDVIDTQPTLINYLGGTPAQSKPKYIEASPAMQVTRSSPPVLLFQGARDQVVAPQNAEFLVAQLKLNDIPFEYISLPWANHGFDFRNGSWNAQISQNKILAFLNKYL